MRSLAALAAALALAGCGTSSSAPAEDSTGRVVRVVDGDTLVVATGGERERVRLLGIDTPELRRDGGSAECGADAAGASLAALAAPGARVRLTTDPDTGDVRDDYGRLLAFAAVGGRDLGLEQLRRGWAEVFAYRDRDFTGRDRYERAYAGAGDRGVRRRC